jgi:ABC-type lipoprotein release transport system permease subunit
MATAIFEGWNARKGTHFAVLGVLAGLLVWALGLGRGFDQGLDIGVQTMETGQVQIVSTGGGFDQYFRLRSLIEGIPGVEAASARLEFSAKITNSQGKFLVVPVRAFSFVQENKVTAFQTRVLHGVSGPISGLLIPKSWEDRSFLFPSETASLSSADGTWGPVAVTVAGSLERTSVFLGPDTAFLDLDTAQAILGAQAFVTDFAVRLAPGIDPADWIKDQREAFAGDNADLKSWKDQSKEFRVRLIAQALPLFIFRDSIVLASLLGVLFLAWRLRKSFPTPRKKAIGLLVGVFALATIATVWILWLLFPLWETLFVESFKADYPFPGPPALSWASGWETVAVPVIVLGICALFRKRGKP